MIKQHNKTGLKYFCKTTRKDPIKYKGSGIAWNNHLKQHGKDITTTWYQLFTNIDELVEFAMIFSSKNNIVESVEWANLIPENGLGSVVGQPGHSHSEKTKAVMNVSKRGVPRSKEDKLTIKLAVTGKKKTRSKKLLAYWKNKKGCLGTTTGMVAWNNGVINRYSKEQPGPEFIKGLKRS